MEQDIPNNPSVEIAAYERFWRLLKPYKLQLRGIYAFAILNGFVNLSLPLGIQAIINYIQAGAYSVSWLILVMFVLLGIAFSGVFQIQQLRIVENLQQSIFAKAAMEFAYRIPKIEFIQLDKIHAPELVNRFFDTLTIQKGLPKILIDFSLAAFQIIFGLILLTIYSPYFILLGLVLFFILWIIFKITGPNGLSTSLEESKYKYKLVHWLEEVARNNGTFKMAGLGELHLETADDINNQYLIARESHFKVLFNQFKLFIGFKVIVAAGLLLLGGFLVFQQQMTIGQFVAAEIIIILIINSVEKVLRVMDTIYDVLTALEKIGYVTDLKLDQTKGKREFDETQEMSIVVEDLNFSFPDNDNILIDDLNFQAKVGTRLLIEGASGSGKSTLLKLIAGLQFPDKGRILINGIPLNNYDRNLLYEQIGMCFPINQIFEGSILNNITLGREIDSGRLEEVIRVLGLNPFLSKQANGLQTVVDSGGKRYPRSIIQKISIARNIIHQPKLLLMEDPLQFIAEDEKRKIIDYLTAEDKKWLLIVVADNPYWKTKTNLCLQLT